MKQITYKVTIIFLSLILLSSCRSWNEKKDHELQKLIDNIDFDKKIIILEPTYRYLFEQFNEEAIEKAEYKIKLGEKEYFVAQNDEAFYRYGLESYEEEYYLMVSIDTCVLAPRGPKILVMTVKKMEDLNDGYIKDDAETSVVFFVYLKNAALGNVSSLYFLIKLQLFVLRHLHVDQFLLETYFLA